VLLSISPIELMTSSRIWTDDLLTFCVTTAFLLYYIAGERRNIVLSFLAGIFGGLAILTKPSGNTVIVIILAYELLKGRIFAKEFFAFLLSCVLLSMPWHWQMFRTYGSVFYLPISTQPDLLSQDWFKFVFNRPWYMYLVNPPVQTPLFFLAYAGALSIFTRCKNEQERLKRDNKIFLLLWTVIFIASFLMTKVGREMRYILPAYPAIALLSGAVLEAVENKLGKMFGGPVGSALVILAILLCSWWSVSLGFKYISSNLAEIVMPL